MIVLFEGPALRKGENVEGPVQEVMELSRVSKKKLEYRRTGNYSSTLFIHTVLLTGKHSHTTCMCLLMIHNTSLWLQIITQPDHSLLMHRERKKL
jgi:hypothetical protein